VNNNEMHHIYIGMRHKETVEQYRVEGKGGERALEGIRLI
jgi:hypothetical protein